MTKLCSFLLQDMTDPNKPDLYGHYFAYPVLSVWAKLVPPAAVALLRCYPLAWHGVISMHQPFLFSCIQWLINHWWTCQEDGEGFYFQVFKSGNEIHLSRWRCEEKGQWWYGISCYDTPLIQDPQLSPRLFRGIDLMTFHRQPGHLQRSTACKRQSCQGLG